MMKTKNTLLLMFVVLLYGCPNRNFNKPNGTPMIEQVNEEVVYVCLIRYKSKGKEESREIELTKSSKFRPEPFLFMNTIYFHNAVEDITIENVEEILNFTVRPKFTLIRAN